MLEEILEHNRRFVEQRGYLPYETDKYPNQRLAIVTCMDARLMELLPAALGLKNGDAHIVRTAGAMVTDPYGSVVRSLLVGIYTMGVREILVIGHSDCGMEGLSTETMRKAMINRGISPEALTLAGQEAGEPMDWLLGFPCVKESVRQSVDLLRGHPLLPGDVSVSGLIIDPYDGSLQCVSHQE